MGEISTIQWTDATWNIARGCTKVDADCKHCYMFRQSLNATRYKPDQVVKTKTVFTMPLKYKGTKSSCWEGTPLIFTSSLTDFFHPDIDSYRNEAWAIIKACPHLTFQILTKRPERALLCLPDDWGEGYENVWLGTSIGSHEGIDRLSYLLRIPAKIKFLSLEPLHQKIDLMYPEDIFPNGPGRCCNGSDCGCLGLPIEAPLLYGIDWVIVGGESGNENGKYKYRPCKIEWIEQIINQCESCKIPVFVKQMGTYISKQLKMKDRHGGDINEFPEHLRIRQFPATK